MHCISRAATEGHEQVRLFVAAFQKVVQRAPDPGGLLRGLPPAPGA